MINILNPNTLRASLVVILLITLVVFVVKLYKDITSKTFAANTRFLYCAILMLFLNCVVHLFGHESFLGFLDRRRVILYEASYLFYTYYMSFFFYKSLKIENAKISRAFDLIYTIFVFVSVFISFRELSSSTTQTYIHDLPLYMILLNKGFMLSTTLTPAFLFFMRYLPGFLMFIVLYITVSRGLNTKDTSGAKVLLVVSKGTLAYLMAENIQMITTLYNFTHPNLIMVVLIPCYILRIFMILGAFDILKKRGTLLWS